MKLLTGLIVFGMLAVGVIVFLGVDAGDRAKAAQERRFAQEEHDLKMAALEEQGRLGLQRARQLSPVQTAATGMGLMAGAFTVTGVGFYLVMVARRRSQLIWPNKAGQFPQVMVELPNGARAFHDPNRSPTYVTVYSQTAGGGVQVTPIMLPGLTESVRQAAAVQLTTAAVHRDQPLTEEAREMARRLLPARVPAEEVGDASDEVAAVRSGG